LDFVRVLQSNPVAVRVLFTCRHGLGHFHPLVPLARAAAAAGHQVAFATADPFRSSVQEAGFATFSAGLEVDNWREEFGRRFGEFDLIPRAEFRQLFYGHVFTDLEAPPRAADLRTIVEHWQPEVLVHEIAEFAAPLVAALDGIPYATLGVGPVLQPEIAELAATAMGRHWQTAGLAPADARPYRSLYLDPWPASLQAPAVAEVEDRLPIRPEPAEWGEDARVPSTFDDLPYRLTVYVTLGTIFNRDQETFATVVSGLAARPINLIVTLGHDIDPAGLGRQPENVRVVRYLPQAQVLPRCDAVVCHGGASTLLGALSCGLPLLVLPRGADNFYNCERVVAAGAGRRLLDAEITAQRVADEVTYLLADDGHRQAAARIAEEIRAMPAPAQIVPALERLAHAAIGAA
jgi:UDP:flavonoid glycosyltransferase YjiC (YdhE family)